LLGGRLLFLKNDQATMLNTGGMRFPIDVILVCIRWYTAYSLSYRHLEEMMQERGVLVDHFSINRWAIRFLPLLEIVFRKHKRAVGASWRMDETYIKVQGVRKYLYRAVDKAGKTVDFLLTAKCDKAAAMRFFEKAMRNNEVPGTVTMDKGEPTKRPLIRSAKTRAFRFSFGRESTSIMSSSRTVVQSNVLPGRCSDSSLFNQP
jgi:transposase-like protein